jgi:hypothetical protein
MLFKDPKLEEELAYTTVFLQDMAQGMDKFISALGKGMVVTRVKEHICGDSGVHEACRAFDVRDEFDGQRTFTDEEALKIVNFMNLLYPRNDGHPTALHHSFEGGPFHIHVQIAQNVSTYVPEVPQSTQDEKPTDSKPSE